MASALLLAAFLSASTQTPTVEQILREARDRLPKEPRYTAEVEIVRTMGGTTMRANGRVFVGGTRLQRLETETRISPAFPGMPEKTKQTVVADGEYLWVDAETPVKEKIVFRGKMDDLEKGGGGSRGVQGPRDPARMLDELTRRYTLALKGEEDLGGRKVRVLEGTPRPDAPEEDSDPMAAMLRKEIRSAVLKIGVDDGFVYHFELRGAAGAPPLEVRRYSNLRWNPELDPALFKFTVPAGASVQDMSGEAAPSSRPSSGR